MEDYIQLLLAVGRIAIIPLVGYIVIRLARRWPRLTLALLLVLIAVGVSALCYAHIEGFSVNPTTRKMSFGSEVGRICYFVGGMLTILSVPALPLIAVARAKNGSTIGPVKGEWIIALFGYFMACAIFGMVLYSWVTGIVK